ncbi:MAG: FimV/HubP family polar landmark protein, partial [Gemmobacter sp.]
LQPPARSADLGVNQRLAQSLEQAAACLRRNEIDEARRLLEDVIRSGDDTQRDLARLLLSRLG